MKLWIERELMKIVLQKKVSLVPEQCTGIFKVSNVWTNMFDNMMKKKWRSKRSRTSRKGYSLEGVFVFLDSTASPYSKLEGSN